MTDSDVVVVFQELQGQQGKRIGTVTLQVPATLNSLTLHMVDLMQAQLQQWRDDDAIACVVFNGSGEKAFCAGGDVQALQRSAVENPGGPCTYAEAFFEREYRLDYLIHTFPKPTICWGHGIVMGGGLGIFAACGHRIVTEKTRIAMPEVTIALFPDVGGSYFLNRMPGAVGRFLALTAASVNASDALYLEIAEYFVDNSAYGAAVDALQSAHWSADDATDAGAANNKTVASVLAGIAAAASEQRPPNVVEQHRRQIDELCSNVDIYDLIPAITSLKTDDSWLQRAADGLAGGSPLNALLIDRQLQRSKQKTLADVFRSELVLATNIVRYPEFAEGVRALLIDKDRKPQWQYRDIGDVPASLLDSFFDAPWESNPLQDLSAS